MLFLLALFVACRGS